MYVDYKCIFMYNIIIRIYIYLYIYIPIVVVHTYINERRLYCWDNSIAGDGMGGGGGNWNRDAGRNGVVYDEIFICLVMPETLGVGRQWVLRWPMNNAQLSGVE